MSLIIGIDLGTTYSATALVREGVPQIVPHGDERIVPSMVGFTPEGTLLVGTPAYNQYIPYPELTVRSIKRQMGQNTHVTLGERSYTPQEISGIILRELKEGVERQLGQPVERAVITVPAYFSDSARQATHEAGEIAGLTVERIINEPTAAALAYGLDRTEERQLVAVYDLGGGTFDISIIELDAGVVEVRASHGNTQLGGDDFDERLVDYLVEQFMEEHKQDPREDRRAMARLSRAAETAKIALSSQPFARVREEYLLTHEGKPLHLDVELTRAEFEGLISDLLESTLESLDAALSDANIEAEDLSHVLLVGGSTRIPLVWQMVRDHTGLEPEMAINPDEAVALGAAVQAAIIAGEPLDAILVDITPHSLGIEVAEVQFGRPIPDRYSIIIQRNTTIPTSRSEVYSALYPDQDAIRIKVYQGEHPIASRNTLLGEFLFENLKPEATGMPPRVTVQFDFDVNGMLHVSAVDRGSGKQAKVSVKAARAHLSPAEIASTREDLAELKVISHEGNGHHDKWEEDELVVEAEPEQMALLERARQIIKRGSGNISALQSAINALENAINSGDEDAIEEHTETLLDLLYEIEDDDDAEEEEGL
jgi:molecular chaperone DnaK